MTDKYTRPVPDPEQQEGLRVALEETLQKVLGMVFDLYQAEQGSVEGANRIGRIPDTLKDIELDLKAALASPKADHKMGMTDADVDAWLSYALAGIDMTPDERASLKEVCAQAKRCNALEREVAHYKAEATRLVGKWEDCQSGARKMVGAVTAERDDLRRRLDQAVMERIEAEHDKGHAESKRDALAKQVGEMREAIGVGAKAIIRLGAWDTFWNAYDGALAKSQPAEKVCTACMDEGYHGESQYKHTCKPADGKG